MEEKIIRKNPDESFTAKRKDRTFAIRTCLTRVPFEWEIAKLPEKEQAYFRKHPCSPLEVYDSRFSGFKLSLQGGGDAPLLAFIKVDAIPAIVSKSAIALQMYLAQNTGSSNSRQSSSAADMSGNQQSSSGSQTSIAHTVKFRSGNLKDKSPADVLIESGESGMDTLEKQWDFLDKNLSKYPKNKEIMNAIREAERLYKEGKLTASASHSPVPAAAPAPASDTILLYSHVKGNSHGEPDQYGRKPASEINIKYCLSRTYPVYIEISNYRARVETSSTGSVKVQDKQPGTKKNINLTAEEWENALYNMQMEMRMFETVHAAALIKECSNVAKKRRAEYKKAQEDNSSPY